MSIWEFANPRRFIAVADRVAPWVWAAAALLLAIGLPWGLFFTPAEARQGDSARIIYLHVPAAMMAINIWIMMLVASCIWVVRRHHVSALAAKAAAPVGMVMTLVALWTGAIWGIPTWNTPWAFDPRLTSFLILFLFYLGYMALWEAIEDRDAVADMTAILCIVGSVFAVLSRYAVRFWGQGLHQGTSIPVATGERSVAGVYWVPLLLCMVGFGLLFVALVLTRTATEVRRQRLRMLELREARA